MTPAQREELKQLAENPHSMGSVCTVSAKSVLELLAENQQMRALLRDASVSLMNLADLGLSYKIESFLAEHP